VPEEKCNVCGMRDAHHSEQTKKDLVTRLNRIEGQIRGISRMISEDVYCDDVLNQITSINSALNGVKKLLLEAHIKSCVTEQIQEGKLEVIDELMKTIERMIK
jgi:CsoR family transcriptional regulator, copper-sensing transcriptional repressor